MTAMRLHRYPSPSGGSALGKVGVGATMLRSILPAGARWVEYLEGTGTQYINLGFGFYKTDTVKSLFSLPTPTRQDMYIVAPERWNTDSNRFGFGFYISFCFAYGASLTPGTRLSPSTLNDGLPHTWKYENYRCDILDLQCGIDVSSIQFGTTTANLKLFYGYSQTRPGKVYYYDHAKAGGQEVKLRPIAIGTTGYMLDLVSGEYLQYGNAGTGNFVLGPDINAPAI